MFLIQNDIIVLLQRRYQSTFRYVSVKGMWVDCRWVRLWNHRRSILVRGLRRRIGKRRLCKSYWRIKRVESISRGSIMRFRIRVLVVGRTGIRKYKRGRNGGRY